MLSTQKCFVLRSGLPWIVLFMVLVIVCTFPTLSYGHNDKTASDNLQDLVEVSSGFNEKEKGIFQIIIKSDSIAKINKEYALEYFESNHDTTALNSINKELLAEYYHIYGKLLVENRKYNIGLNSLRNSLKLKKEIYGNSDSRLAKTYNYLGIAFFRIHNYEEALNNYSKSVEILTSKSFYGRDLFDAYLNIGIVKASLGSFEDAFVYFEDASDIIVNGPAADSVVVARFYLNYGLLATLMGKMELAIDYFEISEAYYIKLFGDNNINLANLNLNKGVNTYINLNYKLSHLYNKKAVDIYLCNNSISIGLIRALNNLCAINRELGNLQASLEYGYQALGYQIPDEMKLLIFQNIIRSFEVLNDYNKTEEYFKKALHLVDQPGFKKKTTFELYLLYANFLLANNDYKNSYSYYKKALDTEGELNGYKTPKYAFVLSRIGFYYLQAEPLSNKSLHYFNRSIEIWQTYMNNESSSASFHNIRFATAYRGKSKALIQKYETEGDIDNLFKSLRTYEWLMEQLEIINRKLQNENQEIVRSQLHPIYNEAIALAYKISQITSNNYFQKKAFSFSEKSKSAILHSSMQNQNALKTSDLPAEILKKDYNLNEEINAIKKQLFDEKQKSKPKRNRLSFFESRLAQLLQSHDSLVRFLENNYPKYYSLKYDLSIIGFDKIKRRLSNNEALIEYQLFDSSLYIFTIRNKKLFTHKISVDLSFYKSLNYFITLKNADLTTHTRHDFNVFLEHSNNLYAFLIEPVYKLITDKKLIIIPSGLLGYLPFELLVKRASKVNELEYNSLDYLLREFPISYSYSSTLRFSPFFNNRTYKTSMKSLFMSAKYSGNGSESVSLNDDELSDLPFAESEVDVLYDEYGGMLIKGDRALKSSFLKVASNFDILHFAMHTIINDSLPMYSKLVFSDEGSNENNRFLNTSEIYGLNLRASMVTLSACNTGAGVLQKGEGIMSLARGFVFAGVPSVVMTLWEVQDESGMQIMKTFYSNLTKGLSKDEAMQLAKIEMLNSANMIKSHPNFWSGYIVTGDTAPLNINDERNDVWLLIFFAIVLVTLFNLYKRSLKDVKH